MNEHAHAPPSAREGQYRSPFTSILETLCDSCLGAIAAGLIDEEGECVDLAFLPSHDIPAYSIKLCGAHWQIVMRDAASSAKLEAACGRLRQMWVRADDFSFVLAHLHAGYVLVLICRPGSLASVSARALRQAEVELYAEAGWPQRKREVLYWRRAHVHVDAAGAPRAVRYARGFSTHTGGAWDEDLVSAAQIADLADFERGFDVQNERGHTFRLVREASGFWYAGAAVPTDQE